MIGELLVRVPRHQHENETIREIVDPQAMRHHVIRMCCFNGGIEETGRRWHAPVEAGMV